MNRTTRRLLVTATLLALTLVPTTLTAQVDMSRYVALGDSLTAAFSSGGLVADFQVNSYPALIFRQADGTRPFEQPLISSPGIPALLELQSLSPITIGPSSNQLGDPVNLFLPRPYDNLGVVGADVNDLLTTVTDNGGFHDLVLRGFGTALQQALALQPSFVTLYIGQNDNLGAALSGIVVEGATLTRLADFRRDYETIAGTLAASGAGLAFATLADVTTIPYVTTVPPFVVDPATSEPVVINGGLVPLLGPNGPLSAADFVLLTATGLLAQGIGIPVELGGTGQRLPDQVVLDAAEAAAITARTNEFNDVIRAAAAGAGAAIVEVGAAEARVAAEGIIIGGVEFTSDFLTGGVFGYDGFHGNAMGYAIVANVFIEAINDHFGAEIPLVDLAPFAFEAVQVVPAVTRQQAAQVIFTRQAYEQLRTQLGIPSWRELKRMKAEGGGGDGPGVGDDPGGRERPSPPKRPTVPVRR